MNSAVHLSEFRLGIRRLIPRRVGSYLGSEVAMKGWSGGVMIPGGGLAAGTLRGAQRLNALSTTSATRQLFPLGIQNINTTRPENFSFCVAATGNRAFYGGPFVENPEKSGASYRRENFSMENFVGVFCKTSVEFQHKGSPEQNIKLNPYK